MICLRFTEAEQNNEKKSWRVGLETNTEDTKGSTL